MELLRDLIHSLRTLGRLLTRWVPQQALRALDIRFAALTRVGETITCTGRVVEVQADGLLRVQLQTTNEHGEVKLSAQALLAWPEETAP